MLLSSDIHELSEYMYYQHIYCLIYTIMNNLWI